MYPSPISVSLPCASQYVHIKDTNLFHDNAFIEDQHLTTHFEGIEDMKRVRLEGSGNLFLENTREKEVNLWGTAKDWGLQ